MEGQRRSAPPQAPSPELSRVSVERHLVDALGTVAAQARMGNVPPAVQATHLPLHTTAVHSCSYGTARGPASTAAKRAQGAGRTCLCSGRRATTAVMTTAVDHGVTEEEPAEEFGGPYRAPEPEDPYCEQELPEGFEDSKSNPLL